jgi:hypothetical protein
MGNPVEVIKTNMDNKITKNDFRVITTTNENDMYLSFWPTMASNWKWYGFKKIVCGFITNRDKDDRLVQEMSKYGEIILFKPLKGVEDSIQAKATRMYLATQYSDDFCMIGDIDMYILNKEETWEKWFSHVVDDKLLCICANNGGPYKGTDIGKFPMAFTAARNYIWKEIVNPLNLSYDELFASWYNLHICDRKEKVNQPFRAFSDESLLRALIYKWSNFNNSNAFNHPSCVNIERDDWDGLAKRRIDRSRWLIDSEKLNSGYYYDSQPVRPFNENINNIKPILNYIGIDENNWSLKNNI